MAKFLRCLLTLKCLPILLQLLPQFISIKDYNVSLLAGVGKTLVKNIPYGSGLAGGVCNRRWYERNRQNILDYQQWCLDLYPMQPITPYFLKTPPSIGFAPETPNAFSWPKAPPSQKSP